MIAPYLPGLGDIAEVAITWAICLILALAGTALAGRQAAVECRVVAGWGALCAVLTLWGVFVPASLRLPAIGFLIAIAVAQADPERRLDRADWRAVGRLGVLSLPLWLVMAPIRPSQPDTFLNLLPNAFYLVDYGRLPTAALPPSGSYLPAAPYNAQFLAFLGALADPVYPSSGMSLLNVLLLVVGGLAVGRALCGGPRAPSWPLVALGLLLATLLNPGFVPRIEFAAYGETALMVGAALAALLFVSGQAELARGLRPPWLALALILAAMVNAKQSGIGLVAAVAGGAAVAGLAERAVPRMRLLGWVVLALIPAALLYLVWRWHVGNAGVAELTPLPWREWHWATVPAILAAIGRAIAEKPVYFGCVAATLAALPVMLRRFGWSATTRLLALHAAALVLYNGFLLLTYIAHFSDAMSAEAHSYFRYSTHLSLIVVLCLTLTARDLWASAAQRHARPLGAFAIGACLLVPLGFAYRLRFDLAMPQPLVWSLADMAKPHLRDGDRLALLLPGDNGSVAAMLGGVLTEAPPRRRLDLLIRSDREPATLDEAAGLGYRLALVTCTADGRAALLQHGDGGWREIAAWTYPPEAFRRRWQAILAPEPLCRKSQVMYTPPAGRRIS